MEAAVLTKIIDKGLLKPYGTQEKKERWKLIFRIREFHRIRTMDNKYLEVNLQEGSQSNPAQVHNQVKITTKKFLLGRVSPFCYLPIFLS